MLREMIEDMVDENFESLRKKCISVHSENDLEFLKIIFRAGFEDGLHFSSKTLMALMIELGGEDIAGLKKESSAREEK